MMTLVQKVGKTITLEHLTRDWVGSRRPCFSHSCKNLMLKALLGRKKPKQETELTPTKRRAVSAGEFLDLCEESPDNIKSSSYVPPKLGRADFGHFEVEFKRPVYSK